MPTQTRSPIAGAIFQTLNPLYERAQDTANKFKQFKVISDLKFKQQQEREKLIYDTKLQRLGEAFSKMPGDQFGYLGGPENAAKLVAAGGLSPRDAYMSPQQKAENEFKQQQWEKMIENLNLQKKRIEADMKRIEAAKKNHEADTNWRYLQQKNAKLANTIKMFGEMAGTEDVYEYDPNAPIYGPDGEITGYGAEVLKKSGRPPVEGWEQLRDEILAELGVVIPPPPPAPAVDPRLERAKQYADEFYNNAMRLIDPSRANEDPFGIMQFLK